MSYQSHRVTSGQNGLLRLHPFSENNFSLCSSPDTHGWVFCSSFLVFYSTFQNFYSSSHSARLQHGHIHSLHIVSILFVINLLSTQNFFQHSTDVCVCVWGGAGVGGGARICVCVFARVNTHAHTCSACMHDQQVMLASMVVVWFLLLWSSILRILY